MDSVLQRFNFELDKLPTIVRSDSIWDNVTQSPLIHLLTEPQVQAAYDWD